MQNNAGGDSGWKDGMVNQIDSEETLAIHSNVPQENSEHESMIDKVCNT